MRPIGMTRYIALVAFVALAACSSSSEHKERLEPTPALCEKVANHVVDVMVAGGMPDNLKEFRHASELDDCTHGTSDPRCLLDATTKRDITRCDRR